MVAALSLALRADQKHIAAKGLQGKAIEFYRRRLVGAE